MADNRITINAEFGQSYKDLGFVGRVGENDSREIVFDCADALAQFPGASIVCVIRRACDIKPYSATLTEDGNSRILPLSAVENAVAGQIMIELRTVSNDTILKSAMFSGRIAESLQGEGDRPGNPVRDVLDRVDATLQSATETQKKLLSALDGVDTAVDDANTAAENAQTVADTVQAKLDNGDFVGAPGPKGDSGTDASVTADNIQAALGYTPVKDVQVAGSSVLDGGVANVPMASETKAGVIKAPFADRSFGILLNKDHRLYVAAASEEDITARQTVYRPLVPARMDYAMKAAMCDGKGAAWTSAEQKAARERMGIDKAYELIESITTDGTAIVERTQEPDGTPYNFSRVKVVVTSPKNMESAIYIYGYISSGGAIQSSPAMFAKDSPYYSRAMYSADVANGIMSYTSTDASIVYSNNQAQGDTDASGVNQSPTLLFTSNNIDKIRVYAFGTTAAPAGFLIQIYGVRAQ